MAVITYRVTTNMDGNFGMLDQLGDQAAASRTDGWTSAKIAAGLSSPFDAGVKQASGTFSSQTTTPKPPAALVTTTAAGAFTTPGTLGLRGVFAATAWTFTFAVRCTTASSQRGRMLLRVFKSMNIDGTGATELTSGPLVGTTVAAALSTSADQTSTVTWSPGAITLNGEFLFFVLAWEITTAGGSNSADVLIRTGQSATGTRFVTPDWVPVYNPVYTTLIDDFNRANGTVMAGAGASIWRTNYLGTTTAMAWASVASNQFMSVAPSNPPLTVNLLGATDFDLLFDCVVSGTGSSIFFLCIVDPELSTYDCVQIMWTSGSWFATKYTDGSGASMGSSKAGTQPVAGETVWIEKRGTNLSIYKGPTGGAFTLIGSWTGAPLVSGPVGFAPGDSTYRWDNLRGGPITVPPKPTEESVYDDFNRADGLVHVGAGATKWSDQRLDYVEATQAKVISNQMGLTNATWYQAVSLDTLPAIFDLVFDLPAIPSSPQGEFGVWFCVETPPATGPSGYVLIKDLAGLWAFRNYVSGTNMGTLASTSSGPTLRAGDSIWIQKAGTTIAVYHKRTAGVYSLVTFYSSATQHPSGRFAIEMSDVTVRIDNVRGGPWPITTFPVGASLQTPSTILPAPIATLKDTFDSVLDKTTKWPASSAGAVWEDSQAKIPCTPSAEWIQTDQSGTYDLTDTYIFAKITPAPPGTGTRETWMEIQRGGQVNQDKLSMGVSGTTLYMRRTIGGVVSNELTIPYDPVAHKWWSISEGEGWSTFDTSPDGFAWSQRHGTVPGFSVAKVWVSFSSNYYGTETAADAYVDNVNVVPIPVGASLRTPYQSFVALPTYTALIDDFNRANGSIRAGAGAAIWSASGYMGGSTFPTIVSNQAAGTGSADRFTSVSKLAQDFDLLIDCVVVGSLGIMCCGDEPGSSTFDGYEINWGDFATNNLLVQYYVNGSATNVVSSRTVPRIVAGDTVWLSKRGTQFSLYKKSAGGNYILAHTWTDSLYNRAGLFGFYLAGTTAVRWDNVSGGPIYVTTPVGSSLQTPFAENGMVANSDTQVWSTTNVVALAERTPWATNAKVGLTERIPYGLTNLVTNSDTWLYAVRQSTSAQRQVPWSTLGLVGNSELHLWATRQAIGTSNRNPYGLSGSVGNSDLWLYSIPSAVGTQERLPWVTRQAIGNSETWLWGAAGPTAASIRMPYPIIGFVASALRAPYGLLGSVSNSDTWLYSLLLPVGNPETWRWSTNGLVSNSDVWQWTTRNAAGLSRRTPYDSAGIAAVQVRMPYGLTISATNSDTWRWSLGNAVGQIDTWLWTTRNLAGLSRRTPYEAAGIAAALLRSPYTLGQAIGLSERLPFATLITANAQRRTPYALRILAGLTMRAPYGAAVLAALTLRLPHTIQDTVANARTFRYTTGSAVNVIILTPWSTRQLSGNSSSTPYALFNLTNLSLSSPWVTVSYASAGRVFVWDTLAVISMAGKTVYLLWYAQSYGPYEPIRPGYIQSRTKGRIKSLAEDTGGYVVSRSKGRIPTRHSHGEVIGRSK